LYFNMYSIKVINHTDWDLLQNITTNIYCYYLRLFCGEKWIWW